MLRLGGAALADAGVAGALSSFADTDQVSDWARADVAMCIEQGIVGGIKEVDGGMLAPLANITRAEAAVMIARFWDR